MSLATRIDRLERNLIINGGMDVWQRGTATRTVGPGGTRYLLADRFRGFSRVGTSPTFTMDQSTDVPTWSESGYASAYSLLVTGTATGSGGTGDQANIYYTLEGHDLAPIRYKKATLSFWVKSSLTGRYYVNFQMGNYYYNAPYDIASANVWQKVVITIDLSLVPLTTESLTNGGGMTIYFQLQVGSAIAGTVGSWTTSDHRAGTDQVNFFSAIGRTFRITQIMLNEGEYAGTFSRAGRTIQDEVILCQRYYFPIERLNIPLVKYGTNNAYESPQNMFPVPMRAAPTFENVSGFTFPGGYPGDGNYLYGLGYINGFVSGTGLTYNAGASVQGWYLNANATSGMSGSPGETAYFGFGTPVKCGFSAEL